MSKHYLYLLHTFIVIGLLVACDNSEAEKSNLPAMQPVAPHAEMGNITGKLSGIVTETMDAGGYTYVQIDTGTEKIWVAGPLTSVEVGSQLSISKNMPMVNYHSQSLDRDFDVIYFVNSIAAEGAVAESDLQMPHSNLGDQSGVPLDIDIKKAEGGNNIAEIIAGQEKLSDQSVRVRGQVVKYNKNIMGKDWIHIRDGSGDNDLTITTNAEVALGDIILAEGNIVLNKDFGHGYVYEIIMEDAKVTVENN